LHRFVFSDDKLDCAGHYIKNGNLKFDEQIKTKNGIVSLGNFINIFDKELSYIFPI